MTGTAIRYTPCVPICRVSAKNISLDRKPFSSGTPAIAAAATMASTAVKGMVFPEPVEAPHVARAALVVDDAGGHEQRALKVAWLRMWNTAATAASGVPRPSSRVIRPRWLIVE